MLLRGVREVVYTTLAVLVEIGWPPLRRLLDRAMRSKAKLA